MGKPFQDWTVGEIQKECRKGMCNRCALNSDTNPPHCVVMKAMTCDDKFLTPYYWEMPELSPMTESELAICRAMGAKWVSQDQGSYNTHVSLWDSKPKMTEMGLWDADNSFLGFVRKDRFPSVYPGTCMEVPDG